MRFICDIMLGKLVKYMRILGLDTVSARSIPELGAYSDTDELPYFFTKRNVQQIPYANWVFVKSDIALDQLREIKAVIKPYINKQNLMNRCIRCNSLLSDIGKDDIEGLVPEFIFHRYDRFKTCLSCRKIYWEGSHVERMSRLIEAILT